MKDPVERMEQNTTIEKIFANHILDTIYISKNKKLIKFNSKNQEI